MVLKWKALTFHLNNQKHGVFLKWTANTVIFCLTNKGSYCHFGWSPVQAATGCGSIYCWRNWIQL